MGTHQNDPPRPATYHLTGEKGGREKRGVNCHFSNSSIIKDYFKTLISHNRRAMLAPSLLQCQSSPISFLRAVKRENVSYIVTRAYKIPAGNGPHFSVSYTTFYRQHLCGRQCTQEQSWPQQHMWNSKLFVLFPLNILLHTVYIFNIFMWTEVIDSRRL